MIQTFWHGRTDGSTKGGRRGPRGPKKGMWNMHSSYIKYTFDDESQNIDAMSRLGQMLPSGPVGSSFIVLTQLVPLKFAAFVLEEGGIVLAK